MIPDYLGQQCKFLDNRQFHGNAFELLNRAERFFLADTRPGDVRGSWPRCAVETPIVHFDMDFGLFCPILSYSAPRVLSMAT